MTALLEATHITKQFPGTLALDNVDLTLQPGEIHAILGENGAGKSTLMKILSGVYTADDGQILFDGQRIAPGNPQEALALGIAIVHQELSLVPALTVGENIYPGRLPTNRLGMVKYQQLYNDARQELSKLDVHVDPRTPVSNLSVANQQLVEITKALSSQCRVLILDEPTSALTEREAENLFTLLRRLAADGVGILYISHKLSEIFALADRVTVLRDGKYIGTRTIADINAEDLIRMMVGRELGEMYPEKSSGRGAPILEVRNLRLPGQIARNSFTLYEGEILGFAGLIGSGRSELARTIFGADPKEEGEIVLNGEVVNVHSPQEAIKRRIGYLPEDRKAAGLFLDMPIKINLAVSILDEVSTQGFVIPRKEKTLGEEYVERLNVSTPSVDQEIRRLSGGNQQKVLVGKWLAIQPRVLIVDEPTRGIDVGAKREIHYLLRRLAEEGMGIIMISSELPEILGMSDRVMVMHEGAIVADLDAATATEESIMIYASGQHEMSSEQ